MRNKTTLCLTNRLNQIEKQINDLSIEYNQIVHELKRRNPNLINDVNLQQKETLEILIDNLINETYQDDLGEYTRIYPVRECCKERLKVVKKKVRKYEDNRFVSENK